MISIEKAKSGNFEIKNELGHIAVGLKAPGGDEGLTPLELMSSSLGLCLSLNLDQLIERDQLKVDEFKVDVRGEKSTEKPARMARFIVEITFKGDFDERTTEKFVKMAKRACTIGNTLAYGAEIDVNVNQS